MKKLAFISGLIFMTINIFSQADFIFNKKNSFQENLKLLACNNGHVFFVGSDLGKEIMLYNYNEIDLSSNKSKEIKYPEIDGERSKYLDVLYFRNKIILFTTISNKNTKEYSLIATQIDENGDVAANGKIIDKIKWVGKTDYYRYKVSFSNDSSKLLVYRKQNEYIDNNTKSKFGFKVLNEKMDILLDKEFELPLGIGRFAAEKFLLDKENNISFIESEYQKGDLYNVCVVQYKSKDDKLIRNDIRIDEKRFLNLELQLTAKEDVLLTGAYAIDKDFGGSWEEISSLKGVFCVLIDKTTNNITVKYKKDLDVLLTGDRKTNVVDAGLAGFTFMVDNGKNLYRYRLKNTFQLENNQVVLFVQFEHSINGVYVKGPIISINFNLKNELDSWVKAYGLQDTKANNTNNKESFSYVTFVRNGKINVLYNFNKLIQINKDGSSVDKSIYLETKENKNLFLCNIFRMVKPNELLILGTEGNLYGTTPSYVVCKLNFKD
jgi:hypothetical protein